MQFNSILYLLYLPLCAVVYRILSGPLRNLFLAVASYVFYGWWDYRFLSLLFVSTVVDFVCGLLLESSQSERRRTLILWASMGTNLGILGYFKYFGFFVDSATIALARLGFTADLPILNIILPVGISFYTFQTMSYTIDIYRRQLKPTHDFTLFMAFTSFFPQLVAGPIERAKHLIPQLEKPKKVTAGNCEEAFALIVLGLFKKVVIADSAAGLIGANFEEPGDVCFALAAVYLFAIQIYGDFSGYSSIARGSAMLFGIDLMVNFRQPYLAQSITDFWRRWHISLSSWLRDYLYIPLGGNRKGTLRTYLNLMITMTVGGLWHGPAWRFVIWGGLHGGALAFHKLMLRERDGSPATNAWVILLKRLATFHLVCLGWIFFRAENMAAAQRMLMSWTEPGTQGAKLLVLTFAILLGTLCLDLLQERAGRHPFMLGWNLPFRVSVYTAMMFVIGGMFFRATVPFIYFQF